MAKNLREYASALMELKPKSMVTLLTIHASSLNSLLVKCKYFFLTCFVWSLQLLRLEVRLLLSTKRLKGIQDSMADEINAEDLGNMAVDKIKPNDARVSHGYCEVNGRKWRMFPPSISHLMKQCC
jgi:hypothetical protein